MVEASDAVSGREAEVLAAVAEHLTNAEIGLRLHISVRTVESHVSSLLRKLGRTDRRALAEYGRDLGRSRADDEARGDSYGRTPGLQGAPAALTSFIGRDAALDAVEEAVTSARLVNLVGPGGVGKTRLAIEAAARAASRFPGGAWFVDLVPIRSGGVATAVAAAVGLVDRPNRSLEDVIEESLRARRALLLVDNCEHVLEATAALLQRMLVACPGLRAIATSRELLGVTGERVVPVAPMEVTDAVTLFVDRTRSLDPAFDGETEADLLAEVCARLDGIPLAIELASVRCALLGLDGVRAGLADRLRLLTGARRADERHRSLRAVLDWSYELLDPSERTVLRRLSVFAGDFAMGDAAQVVGDGVDEDGVVDVVARLTAKSLLVRRSSGPTTVYRLLETVREYALARLDESGEADAVRRHHLDWALSAVTSTEARLVAGEEWRHRFDAIADDVRLALGWAVTVSSAVAETHELACSHAHVAYARRFLSEAEGWYEQASALASDDRTAAADLRSAAVTAFARMRADRAYEHYLHSAERGATVDPASAVMSLADAASLVWRCAAEFRTTPSRERVLEVLAQAEALDPGDEGEASARLAVARAWLASAEPGGADIELARLAVAAARAIDDPPLVSAALDAETAAVWDLGHVGAAVRLVDERLALLDRFDRHDPRTGGEVLDMFHMAADTALAAGRLGEALDHAMLIRKDEMGETAPHLATRQAVIALTLLGRFTEAITEADAMRRDWERAGRPSAAWMTPAATAAELAHALLGDRTAAAEWAGLTKEVAGGAPFRSVNRTFMAFATARVALHEGRLDDALGCFADLDPGRGLAYLGYALALKAELTVVAGLAEASDALVSARSRIDEHAWANACLLRAEARLDGDPATMQAALDAFDDLDSRFEWAVTALLVGGDTAERARTTFAELGTSPPAVP
ncbi:MAG: ATP-binding protein [Acidimicrobiales bacterium]